MLARKLSNRCTLVLYHGYGPKRSGVYDKNVIFEIG